MRRVFWLLFAIAALGLYSYLWLREGEEHGGLVGRNRPDGASARKAAAPGEAGRREPEPQTRPHGERVPVPLELLAVDDGDTGTIRWPGGDLETVRILGIDTPETRHDEHDIPYDQPFGPEARSFAKEAFGGAKAVELLRSATLDPYGRTLGYFYLDGQNYSVRAVEAGVAVETVGFYGDNGLPEPAAEVTAAAAKAGPPKFEAPHLFRRRMKQLSQQLKAEGRYPPPPGEAPPPPSR